MHRSRILGFVLANSLANSFRTAQQSKITRTAKMCRAAVGVASRSGVCLHQRLPLGRFVPTLFHPLTSGARIHVTFSAHAMSVRCQNHHHLLHHVCGTPRSKNVSRSAHQATTHSLSCRRPRNVHLYSFGATASTLQTAPCPSLKGPARSF